VRKIQKVSSTKKQVFAKRYQCVTGKKKKQSHKKGVKVQQRCRQSATRLQEWKQGKEGGGTEWSGVEKGQNRGKKSVDLSKVVGAVLGKSRRNKDLLAGRVGKKT